MRSIDGIMSARCYWHLLSAIDFCAGGHVCACVCVCTTSMRTRTSFSRSSDRESLLAICNFAIPIESTTFFACYVETHVLCRSHDVRIHTRRGFPYQIFIFLPREDFAIDGDATIVPTVVAIIPWDSHYEIRHRGVYTYTYNAIPMLPPVRMKFNRSCRKTLLLAM